MNVYLAARYSRRLELCAYKVELEAAGHNVTSRWLLGGHQIDNDGRNIEDSGKVILESEALQASLLAREDVEDVRSATALIAFTESPGGGAGRARGGRHVELGLALAWCLEVIVVGPRENVFCWLPEVRHQESWSPRIIKHLNTRDEQIEKARWARLP